MYIINNKFSRNGESNSIPNLLQIDQINETFFKNLTVNDEIKLIGGDGTINWAINKLRHGKLIVTNKGTGNDLFRSLTEKYQPVNIGMMNNKLFANGCGIGFDSLVCANANNQPRKGKLSYVQSVVTSLRQFVPFTAAIHVDGRELIFNNVYFVSCQNGKYIGSGMKIAPKANINTSTSSLVIIHNISKLKLLLIFPLVFLGLHENFHKYVTTIEASYIQVATDSPLYSQMDGEVQPLNDKFEIFSHVKNIYMKRDQAQNV